MEALNQNAVNAHSRIRGWLASRFGPVCSVFASPTVKDILKTQSSLTPSELLRPFGEVGNLNNISLQTCDKNQAFKLKNFKVDFVEAKKIDSNSYQESSWLIDYIIQNYAPKKVFSGLQKANQANSGNIKNDMDLLQRQLFDILYGETNDTLTPWYTKWRQQFLNQTKFIDHELTFQPVAFIYFISAMEHDPLGTIDVLRRAENLPKLYKEGIYDDSIQNTMQFVLILNQTDNEKVFQDAQDSVKQKFATTNIFEIPMTALGSNEPLPPDIWQKMTDLDEENIFQEGQNPLDIKPRGTGFSLDDRSRIKSTIKRIIEKLILPFIEKKIRNLEMGLATTRKGFKNQFKSIWKKASERNENEGLKENFKMNKSELELVSLLNTAFSIQDYETAINNGKFPFEDFKNCKAFRHAGSCLEQMLLARIAFDTNFTMGLSTKEFEQMIEQAYNLFQRSGKSQFMIRFAMLVSEMYECLEKWQESANFLLRIANEIKDSSVIGPLFLEQASFKFLHMRKYRKFALYMVQAGRSYEKLGLQNYAFNCFTIVHPFYQRHKGWNGIRFQLYSTLGRSSQSMGDANLTVTFLRNLLQLCCEFEHMQEQKNCLNEFLLAVSSLNKQKQENLIGLESGNEKYKTHIGQLNLPVVLEDSIEVFISSEKIYTNKTDQMINQLYLSYPATSANMADENQEYVIQQKAEFNSQTCPWKFMAKHLFEFMNEEKRKDTDISPTSAQFNQEEINEFAVYDCNNRARKRDLTVKKVRKAFVGETITVKLLIRNPLMADITINSMQLICEYVDDTNKSDSDIEMRQIDVTLRNLETKEIILEIVPKKKGALVVKRLEWQLFDVVQCAYQLVKSESEQEKRIFSQEDLQVSKKLLEREMNFKYEILERSAELQSYVKLQEEQESQNFIFTELQQCQLILQNTSDKYRLKNGFIVCSHPIIFGFYKMKIFDFLEASQRHELKLNLRSSLMHGIEIKFLIRYEVDKGDENDSSSAMSRFRFTRVLYNIQSDFAFQIKKHVHMSSKNSNEYIVNIQVFDLMQLSSYYQTPVIKSIEILNEKRLWTIKKKDQKGNFFIIMPFDSTNEMIHSEPDSMLVFNEYQGSSVLADEVNANFLHQEHHFIMTKYKTGETQNEEEVDIIAQWEIPQLKKKGMYCLFKVPLLRFQKQITEQQTKLQRQKSQNYSSRESTPNSRDTPRRSILEIIPKVNPFHLAFQYQKSIQHDFSQQPTLIVVFNLTVGNMIQNQEIAVNCRVEAENNWTPLNNPSDTSEGESFIWIGKIVHTLKKIRINQSKTVELKCAITQPGVYNLNRFKILIDSIEGTHHEHMFVNEVRIKDEVLINISDFSS